VQYRQNVLGRKLRKHRFVVQVRLPQPPGHCLGRERHAPFQAFAVVVDGRVDHDPPKPGQQGRLVPEFLQAPECLQEPVVHHLAGVFPAVGVGQAYRQGVAIVPFLERFPGCFPPLAATRNHVA
jgi:hypothetical protein